MSSLKSCPACGNDLNLPDDAGYESDGALIQCAFCESRWTIFFRDDGRLELSEELY